MNTAKLKSFSQEARKILMQGVSQKLAYWGFDAKGVAVEEPTAVQGGYMFRGVAHNDDTVPAKWKALKAAVGRKGVKQVIEEATYTWFNRMIAIRILAQNGYDPAQLEFADGADLLPVILQKARRGSYDFLTAAEKKRLAPLLTDFSKDTEAFAILMVGYCHSHPLLERVFGNIDDYTELLLPDNILAKTGFLHYLNTTEAITKEDYQQVELIGWLYQFYISERKDEVFASFKQNKKAEAADIPAATQIFTPNWIVKYMVQNTVGKLWLDLHPDSPVKPQLKYLVENDSDQGAKPVINEASDIKLLDPACGSGHILVEGFDVLYLLFLEEYYTPEEAVETILTKCLYGLDIDKRAMQLSRFAVLLKAAKAYPEILKKDVLPHIYSMPEPDYFSRQEVLDFLGAHSAHEEALSDALKLMRDAQNLGSIMQFDLEEEAIHSIRQRLDEFDSTDTLSFNEQALLPRIRPYIEVLLVLTHKYEAVVANPPYMGQGTMNASLKDYVNLKYPVSKSDLFAVFMEVCLGLNEKRGLMGMINQHSWMFLSSYEKLREEIIGKYVIINMLHLGPRTFEELSGEVVQSTAFVIQNSHPKESEQNLSGTYYRLVDFKSTGEKNEKFLARENRHSNIPQTNFSKIPGSPIAYWVSDKTIIHFEKKKGLRSVFKSGGRIKTHGNDKYLRLFWELSVKTIGEDKPWLFVENGGEKRKWFGNRDTVVDWSAEAIAFYDSHGGLSNSKFWKREGISWAVISSRGATFRFKDNGAEYTSAAPTIFPLPSTSIKYSLAFLNTKYVLDLLNVLNPTVNTTAGDVISIPFIIDKKWQVPIEELCETSIDISRSDWNRIETSWDFRVSPFLIHQQSLSKSYLGLQESATTDFFQLLQSEEEINRMFINIYGMQDELTPEVGLIDITILQEELDRGQLEADEPALRAQGIGIAAKDQGLPLVPDGYELPIRRDVIMKQFISYAIGCFMGRYRLDKPGLHIAHPEPIEEEIAPYTFKEQVGETIHTFQIEEDAILPIMGKSGSFGNDAVLRMQKFIEITWGEKTYTENMNFLEECLNMDLEKYLVSKFWPDHKKTYKKKPIYWLFCSENGAFQVLVYMHRMNRFTVEKIRSEYLLPHLRHLQTQIDLLTRSGQDPKKLEKLQKDQMECESYDLILKDKADQQIEFDLDDGVTENYKLFDGVVGEV